MDRPSWSGQVQISLVTFGVRLFTATESKSQISLREIDRRTGERIRHQNVTDSGTNVDRSDIVKGYEVGKGEYILLEPDELERLRIPSKRRIEIRQFVEPKEIDFSFFEKPYFVVPEKDADSTTFNVVHRAMAETGKAGLGEVALGGRERLVALIPADGKESRGMMAYILRYSEELRDGSRLFSEIKDSKIEADQLTLAKELIRRNSSRFDPSKFQDDYESALREAIEAKVNHKSLPRESARRAKVINLTDALRQSLGKKNTKKTTEKSDERSTIKSGRSRSRKGPVLLPMARKRQRAG